MTKQDLKVVKVVTADNVDLAFIYAYEVRVQNELGTDFVPVVTYFDEDKAVHACGLRLDSCRACYVAKIRIWL